MEERVLGAQKPTPNLWRLTVASAQHTINPTSEQAPAAWVLPESRRSSGAILWTSAQIATLRFSSSLWLSSTQGCIVCGQYAGCISCLHVLERPRGAFSKGGISSRRLSQPRGKPTPIPCPSSTQLTNPSRQDSLLPFGDIPALVYP